MSGMKKDLNELLKLLQTPRYGCTVAAPNGRHWRVTRSGYRAVTVSRSPSDHRALMNIKSDLRKYLGVEL